MVQEKLPVKAVQQRRPPAKAAVSPHVPRMESPRSLADQVFKQVQGQLTCTAKGLLDDLNVHYQCTGVMADLSILIVSKVVGC
jgi:hypothetical protein